MSELDVSRLFSVKGKFVLVTGGGRGIGKMIAEGFAANGATVFLTSRDEKACSLTASEISASSGGKVIALPSCDLASYEGMLKCAASVKEALQKHRGEVALDVLVNNSGVSWGEPLDKFSEKGWDKVMDTNVKAVFFLTRELVPALEAAAKLSTHASIINVGSINGIKTDSLPTFSYDASKAAVHHLGRHFASVLASKRITSNNLAPGLVPSKMSNQLKVYSTEEEMTSGIPLGRKGITRDMAGLCLYFASAAGSWTTGSTVQVDGGAIVSGAGKLAKL